jgi:site-specific DNA recombinase
MTATSVCSETPVGIYCRISDDPEARQVGVDRQAQACRRLASQHGWASVEMYIDNDISAFTCVSRPAYRRMLDDVRLGRLAAIVTWDADRLHRSTRELEDFIDLIEATSTTVVTVTAGTSDFATASGRMQARIKGTVARYESEHKTERVTAAHASLAEAGRWKGGPRPYGYDVGRDNVGRSLNDGRLLVIEHEAAVIREAAAAILAGGSVYGVCRDLNARGVPTAQGARWRTQTMRRILTHATVVGRREYRGEIVGEALWPAILNDEDWQALRQRLGTNPNRSQTAFRRRYLLTGGIAVCGICPEFESWGGFRGSVRADFAVSSRLAAF